MDCRWSEPALLTTPEAVKSLVLTSAGQYFTFTSKRKDTNQSVKISYLLFRDLKWPSRSAANHNRLCFRDPLSLIQVTPKWFSLHTGKRSFSMNLFIAPNTHTCGFASSKRAQMRGETELSSFTAPHHSFLQANWDLGNACEEKRGGMKQKLHDKSVLLSLKKLLRITAAVKPCITFHYIPKGEALQNPKAAITFQLHED